MIGFEWNRCGVCGMRLAPDDFDGICWECDSLPEREDDMAVEAALAKTQQCDVDAKKAK
jgi:hypothetical protein